MDPELKEKVFTYLGVFFLFFMLWKAAGCYVDEQEHACDPTHYAYSADHDCGF